jgi:hypothetical protein
VAGDIDLPDKDSLRLIFRRMRDLVDVMNEMAALPEATSPGLSGRDLVPLARVDFLVFVVLMFPKLHDGKQMIRRPMSRSSSKG